MTDLHIHTSISFDSKEPAVNYLKVASARGNGALGFSEHYDYDAVLDGNRHPLPDLHAYFCGLDRLERLYPEVKILRGIELGYVAEAVPHYNKLLAGKQFDYAIMSVHTLKGRGDCYFPEFYGGWTKEQAYRAYLSAVLESVRCDADFQIVGHVGYIARYAPFENRRLIYSDFADLIDEILLAVISRGLCLEINTKCKTEQFATDRSILERYVRLGGGKFTFGSDAHEVTRYREKEDKVRDFLLSNGIDEIYRFEKGIPVTEKL